MTERKDTLSRKSSQNPNSPFYVNEKEASKITGDMTVAECIRLARVIKDKKNLPTSCKRYIDGHAQLRKACEGMPVDEAKTVIRARETGRLTHAQLQRRWTSRENPLKERKTQLMIAAKIAAEELEQKEKK